jgi:hypothetical protein
MCGDLAIAAGLGGRGACRKFAARATTRTLSQPQAAEHAASVACLAHHELPGLRDLHLVATGRELRDPHRVAAALGGGVEVDALGWSSRPGWPRIAVAERARGGGVGEDLAPA